MPIFDSTRFAVPATSGRRAYPVKLRKAPVSGNSVARTAKNATRPDGGVLLHLIGRHASLSLQMASSSIPARHVPSMKISPPVAPVSLVIRQRVSDMLHAATSAKVVVVRAPAGFGKTTAMLQYKAQLDASSVATAWLTFDSADNDPVRFLSSFDVALAVIVHDDASSSLEHAMPGTIGEIALRIMECLAGRTEPFVLFLDDFEVLQEPGVISWIHEVIDHLPRNGRLVIGARGLPDLKLGRLRARGELLEIDA